MSKIKNGGLDQYDPERFGRLILLHSEKCGIKRVKDSFQINAINTDVYVYDNYYKYVKFRIEIPRRC